MDGSCCPVCNKPLGDQWKFCPNCETYFGVPISRVSGSGSDTNSPYGNLANRYRRRRLTAIAAGAIAIAASFGLSAIFPARGRLQARGLLERRNDLRAVGLVYADMAATAADSLALKLRVANDEIEISSGCTVRCRDLSDGGEEIVLASTRPMTRSAAHCRADFAAHIVSDIRSHYLESAVAYHVTASVYSPTGVLLAASNAAIYRTKWTLAEIQRLDAEGDAEDQSPAQRNGGPPLVLLVPANR